MALFKADEEVPAVLTMDMLRATVVASKQARLAIAVARHDDLARLYFAIEEEDTSRFGAGFREAAGTAMGGGIGSDDVAGLTAFRQRYSDAASLAQLDVTLAPLSPTPPPSPSPAPVPVSAEQELAELTKSIIVESAMDTDTPEPEPVPPRAVVGASVSAQQQQQQVQPPLRPLDTASPAIKSALPLQTLSAGLSPNSFLTVPLHRSPSPLKGSPTASTSALPYAPAATPSPLPATPTSAASLAPGGSGSHCPPFPILEIADDYVDRLPELPLDVFKNRLSSAVRRKGKEKATGASGGPDLFKMNVKAVHTGAKNFFGRNKRVHNVLSTADWGVAVEELRALRAFERIEQLKSEKAWSFRQPKKQRIGAAPKAHWDHLLDEMRWLQTDFRQEHRWKVATAYTVARAVKAWYRASPEDRPSHCVKVGPPTILPLDSHGPLTEDVPMEGIEEEEVVVEKAVAKPAVEEERELLGDMDAEGDVDADADGEADDASVAGRPVKTEGGDAAVVPPATPSAPTDAQRAQAAALHIQTLISQRAPVFELGADVTLVDPRAFSTLDDNESPSISNLFPDIPLYFDADASDKRYEESSAWAGRVTQVTRLLGSKPLLVSTVQPAKVRTKGGWTVSTGSFVDDTKDVVEPREIPPASCVLFSGRKPKDSSSVEVLPKPASVPDPATRAASLHWGAEEDALILSLQRQYGTNWNLIADVFNGSTTRPASDNRLGWDIYDRWDKLAGPSSRKVLEDGTEITIPPPEYSAPIDKSGKPHQINLFDGSKKRLRHLTVFDAMRKLQKKREATAPKPPSNGMPRRINMSMHESHNLPPRQFYTPLELSNVKTEQDQAKIRQRMQAQQEMAIRMQNQQQQQQQQQSMVNGVNGVRYQQPVQGFPLQQPRSALPLNVQQPRLGQSPSAPSPSASNHSPTISSPNGLALSGGGPQSQQQFAQAGGQMTPEQLYRQQMHAQAQAQAQAQLRANASAGAGEGM